MTTAYTSEKIQFSNDENIVLKKVLKDKVRQSENPYHKLTLQQSSYSQRLSEFLTAMGSLEKEKNDNK
ncbi:MAG: hypothetical protein ACOYT8_05395 [Candidatus Dependentiae bacterium]